MQLLLNQTDDVEIAFIHLMQVFGDAVVMSVLMFDVLNAVN
jgi:hypothetical protein